MLASTVSGAVLGIDGYLVRVEVDVAHGVPVYRTVGLPDTSVREARDRVRAALKNSGFPFPEGRITVNLAPASVRKQGSAFDLAVAVGLLAATDKVPRGLLDDTLLLGELALDGKVCSVRGVLPVAAEARSRGIGRIVVASPNRGEAALVEGLGVYPVGHLREVVDLLSSERMPMAWRGGKAPRRAVELPDLTEVKGQSVARRAVEIAAAGGHNLLLYGPPGAGKTLLARRFPSILPELAFEQAIEVTKVHSVAGKILEGEGLMVHPPFRAPHHSISSVAMVGGGTIPLPGEVSLAHHGVLFLDELPEFPRSALEGLRQPLEDGRVTICRVSGATTLPARFMLVAAMNPCPCGYHGAEARACSCSPGMIQRYRARISGPVLDRIDLLIFVRPLSSKQMLAPEVGEPSSAVRGRVLRARKMAQRRFARSRVRLNAHMSGRQLARYCPLTPPQKELLGQAVERWGLSARAFDRILKVARTIADLEGCESIESRHLHEAIQYRLSEME